MSNIYKLFIAEVKKQLYIRGWKYADLSKATGYTVGTIEAFMCGARESERMANCIAQVLDRLVKELRSMSGEFVSFNSDDLIKVSEEKTEK